MMTKNDKHAVVYRTNENLLYLSHYIEIGFHV